MINVAKRLWQENPIRVFATALIIFGSGATATEVVTQWLRRGPQIIPIHNDSGRVVLRGLALDVDIDRNKMTKTCFGAYTLRKVLRVVGGKTVDQWQVMENEPAFILTGVESTTLHLTMYRRVPVKDNLFYQATQYDNCTLFPEIPKVGDLRPVVVEAENADADVNLPRVLHDFIARGSQKHPESMQERIRDKGNSAGCSDASCFRQSRFVFPQ